MSAAPSGEGCGRRGSFERRDERGKSAEAEALLTLPG